MSVINRVLKDLERRQAPEVTQTSAFPPGVRPTRAMRPSLGQWGLLAALVVVVAAGVYWWRAKAPAVPAGTPGPLASAPIPSAPPSAPSTLPTTPAVEAPAAAPSPSGAAAPAPAAVPGAAPPAVPPAASPSSTVPLAPAPPARAPLPAPSAPVAKSPAAPAPVEQTSPPPDAAGKASASQRAAAVPTTGVAPEGELRQAKPNVKPEPLAAPPAVVAAKPERQEPRATKHVAPDLPAGAADEAPLHEDQPAADALPELPAPPDAATKGATKSARAKRDALDVPNAEKPGYIDKQVKAPTNADRADAEFRTGMEAYQAGRFEEADAAWTRAMRLDPGAANARQALLGMLLDRGERARAEQVLKESLQANPRQAKHAMLLARLQLERGSQTEALRTLEDGLPHAQWSAEYLAMTATVLSRTGRNRDAAELYRSALRVGPANPVWEIGLGMALRADGKRAEARAAFERARESKAMTADLQAYVDRQLKELR